MPTTLASTFALAGSATLTVGTGSHRRRHALGLQMGNDTTISGVGTVTGATVVMNNNATLNSTGSCCSPAA